MTKPKRGGARPGAGRPRGEPHKTISFRIPAKHSDVIKNYLTKLLQDELHRKAKTDLDNNSRNRAILTHDLSR
jgi:hypothetical protein